MRCNIQLHNMDCMDALREMEDNQFDLAIVDPPYGLGDRLAIGGCKKRNRMQEMYLESKWEDVAPDGEYFEELRRVSKNQVVWGGNYFTEHLPPSKGWVVWDKKADIKEHLSMCELAWSSFDRKCNKFEFLWAGFKKAEQVVKIHPTQKPVALYKWLLNNYAKEDPIFGRPTILDTHLGSGSIAIACWDLGFDLTGYELDEDYYKAACKRLEKHKAQGHLF